MPRVLVVAYFFPPLGGGGVHRPLAWARYLPEHGWNVTVIASAPGGYFIASTTETSDIHEGLELHQTQWTNAQWREYVAKNHPDLEYVDVGLKIYQFVRYNFIHPSFLLYRKKG